MELVKAWNKEAVACFEINFFFGGWRARKESVEKSKNAPTEYQSGALLLAPICTVADYLRC